MRFRAGILVGTAVGYVLGARAYEQFKRLAAEARQHQAVAQLADQSRGLVDAGRYLTGASLSAGAKGLRQLDRHGDSG